MLRKGFTFQLIMILLLPTLGFTRCVCVYRTLSCDLEWSGNAYCYSFNHKDFFFLYLSFSLSAFSQLVLQEDDPGTVQDKLRSLFVVLSSLLLLLAFSTPL